MVTLTTEIMLHFENQPTSVLFYFSQTHTRLDFLKDILKKYVFPNMTLSCPCWYFHCYWFRLIFSTGIPEEFKTFVTFNLILLYTFWLKGSSLKNLGDGYIELVVLTDATGDTDFKMILKGAQKTQHNGTIYQSCAQLNYIFYQLWRRDDISTCKFNVLACM